MKTSREAWALREKRNAAKRVFPDGIAMIAFSFGKFAVPLRRNSAGKEKESKQRKIKASRHVYIGHYR